MRNPFPLVYTQTASNERKHPRNRKVEETRFRNLPIQLRRAMKNKTGNRIVSRVRHSTRSVSSRRKRNELDVCKMETKSDYSSSFERKKGRKEGRKRGGYQESLLQRRLVIQREACQLGKVARCPVMRRARRPDDEAPALYTPDMRASTTHNANKLHTI